MADKPDGRYSRVAIEVDKTVESDAATVKRFHDGAIGIRIGKGFAVAVLGAAAGAWVTHSQQAPSNCATLADIQKLTARLDQTQDTLGNLVTKVNQDSDRTHNDLELLKLKIDVTRK